jgi:hypothetical protein
VIVDLYDAIDRMLWAIVAWIAIGAAIGTVLVLGLLAGIAWAWRALRERLSARLRPSEPESDHIPDPPAERRSAPHTPAWARTQPHDYEDAA